MSVQKDQQSDEQQQNEQQNGVEQREMHEQTNQAQTNEEQKVTIVQDDESAPVVEGDIQQESTSDMAQRLEEAEKQANDFKEQWLRAMADFKNYKRRAETERSELVRNASVSLILKLLPIVDDFERAASSVPPEVEETPWWQGAQLVIQKLRTILESEGVTPIDALGTDFDPNLHDAVMYEEAEGQDGKVTAELQKGYRLNDRVLRPTMVKVGKG
jgi:molecular chaperone GrpE